MTAEEMESPLPNGPAWVDSHCHLAMEDFLEDREAVVARAHGAGVGRMVVVGTTPEDWESAARWALRPGFRATAGLHPHEAGRWDESTLAGLREALGRPGVTAVGEVGLDYHYDHSPRDVQRRVFERQVGLAMESGLPVVVHSREAFEDTRSILRGAGAGLKGVIHCFTYGPREGEAFLVLGLHLSFSGILTFPKAPLVQEAARQTPPDRLLVETDAPYLAPVPHRGRRCEPSHVADVGRFLATLKGLGEDETARRTAAAAAALFQF